MGLIVPASVLHAFPQLQQGKSIQPFGSGHIHETFRAETAQGAFLLQRFNHQVFQRPYAVANNMALAEQALTTQMQTSYPTDWQRHLLQMCATAEGKFLAQDESGFFWRLFLFQAGTYTVDEVSNPEQAFEAARAFGEFARMLRAENPDDYEETIPGFHDIGKRFARFQQAAKAAPVAPIAVPLVEKALAVQPFVEEVLETLVRKEIPQRLVHNDTKINNVLLDQSSHKGLCVIDWDTIMPGYLLYDFGDMVRTFVSPAREDETDFSKIFIRREIYAALCKGFLSEWGPIISEGERNSLYMGARLLPLLMGLRFLTDFLEGNHYYRIHYPTQNLNRATNQFYLYELLTAQETELRQQLW